MSRYVVIGGGVSGLAAARALAGAAPASESEPPPPSHGDSVVLLEASDRLGGKVRTGRFAGGDVEVGPDQFLRRDASAERLCRQLGLGDALVAPATSAAAVFAAGRPRRLPAGLALGVPTDLDALADSGIVSLAGVEFVRGDAERPGPVLEAADVGLDDDAALIANGRGRRKERSGGAVLRPRLGHEVVDRLVDPLIGGINAGSIDRLSLGTVAPQIARTLVGHHDVVAPLAPLARIGPAGDGSGSAPASPFYGLDGGLGRLVDRIEDELRRLGCEVRLSSAAGNLRANGSGSGYVIETSDGDLAADGVVLAVPGGVAGALLRRLSRRAGSILSALRYASVAVVTLTLDAPVPETLRGLSGLLVPRLEGSLMTAVTLLEQKWPWMSPEGHHGCLVRVSAGRHLDDRIASLDDRALCSTLASELARFSGIDGTVTDCLVQRWPAAFCQYEPGFPRHLAAVREALRAHPGIALAGAALGGIGIPACLTSGERAAQQVRSAVVAA